MADPARKQTWTVPRAVSGGAYISIQNKGGMWPSKYIMMPMGIAINDASCYIIMPSHVYRTWDKSEKMWARGPDHHHLG